MRNVVVMKKYIVSVLVGFVIGLWVGINIGKDQPIWSNPFTRAERSMAEKAKIKVKEMVEDAQATLQKKRDE